MIVQPGHSNSRFSDGARGDVSDALWLVAMVFN